MSLTELKHRLCHRRQKKNCTHLSKLEDRKCFSRIVCKNTAKKCVNLGIEARIAETEQERAQ